MSNIHDIFKSQEFQFPDKHENYEQKICKNILRLFGITNIDELVKAGNLELNLPYICSNYIRGIGLASYKLRNPVMLQNLIAKKIRNTELLKAYYETKQNYPNRDTHALVFDYHGDGIGDMVLHNNILLADDTEWLFRLICDEDRLYIQPYKVFLAQLKANYT